MRRLDCHSVMPSRRTDELAFATHEVVVRGYSLRRLVTALQRQELAFITLLPTPVRDAIPDGQPVLLEISVTKTEQPVDLDLAQ